MGDEGRETTAGTRKVAGLSSVSFLPLVGTGGSGSSRSFSSPKESGFRTAMGLERTAPTSGNLFCEPEAKDCMRSGSEASVKRCCTGDAEAEA